jgi:hypothetical protein
MKGTARVFFLASRIGLVALLTMCFVGCSSEEDDRGGGAAGSGGTGGSAAGGSGGTAGTTDGGSGTSGTGGSMDSGASSVDPFNGDCTSAKWANVSDECWACACTACASALNACDETCIDVMWCSIEQDCLVGVGAEINCEIRCVGNQCLTDMAAQMAAGAVIGFDSCLIGSMDKPAGAFRACEAECGIAYTGTVCERFPMM